MSSFDRHKATTRGRGGASPFFVLDLSRSITREITRATIEVIEVCSTFFSSEVPRFWELKTSPKTWFYGEK